MNVKVTLRLSANGLRRFEGTCLLYLHRLCLPSGTELHRRRPEVSHAPASIQKPILLQSVRLATSTLIMCYQYTCERRGTKIYPSQTFTVC